MAQRHREDEEDKTLIKIDLRLSFCKEDKMIHEVSEEEDKKS